MDRLEKVIRNTVGEQFSCIQEGDVVISPCYLITPFGVGGLKGNGSCTEQFVQCEICFFVETRSDAVSVAVDMANVLPENDYICTDPQIEYEKNAKSWKVIFLAEYVVERNET